MLPFVIFLDEFINGCDSIYITLFYSTCCRPFLLLFSVVLSRDLVVAGKTRYALNVTCW